MDYEEFMDRFEDGEFDYDDLENFQRSRNSRRSKYYDDFDNYQDYRDEESYDWYLNGKKESDRFQN